MILIMCTGIITFLLVEVNQMWRFGFLLHIGDFWNLLYLLIYSLNIAVIAVHMHGGEKILTRETGARMASVLVMLLWVGLFYWLRLFECFSMYVYLIKNTIWDIRAFLFLVLVLLFCFSNGLFILDLKMEEYEFDWTKYEEFVPNL